MALVPRESRENDRDADDVFRRSAFSNANNVRSSATPSRPTTFREDGSSIKLGFGGTDRTEGAIRDTPLRSAGKSVKRGFRGSDVEPGVVRNTPFSESGTPLRKGFGDFDTPSKVLRQADQAKSRIRRPNRRRQAPPPQGSQKGRVFRGPFDAPDLGLNTGKFSTPRGTFTDTGDAFKTPRGTFSDTGDAFKSPQIISPRSSLRQSDNPRQAAARRLVTRPNKGEDIDRSQDFEQLSGPGIAKLSENAIAQEKGNFSSVVDPISGFRVADLGDPETRLAHDRFFKPQSLGFGEEQSAQALRDADPTRASFQNRFFPSETLGDVGIGKNRRFRV